jgi:hypothetical protein
MRRAWSRGRGLAVVAVVCGSLAAGAGLVPAGAAASTTSAATKAATAEAKHSLLRLSDFPSGWTSAATRSATDPTTANRDLASCAGISIKGWPRSAPRATSPRFSDAKASRTLTESVVVYPSAGIAADELDAYTGVKAASCFLTYLRKELAATSTFTSSGANPSQATLSAAAFPRYGNGTAAFTITIPVSTSTFTGDVVVRDVVIAKGRSLAYLSMTSAETAFPSSLADRLATAATRRLG